MENEQKLKARVCNAIDPADDETEWFCIQLTNGKRGRPKPLFLSINGVKYFTNSREECQKQVDKFNGKRK